jgi:hypothetical protein
MKGSLFEEKNKIIFFSFGQVNHVFHKLSVNAKHIQFWLCMSPWWIFIENGYQAHFSWNFWEAPTCHVVEIAQRLKCKVLRKKFVLPIESWFFTFFHFFFLLMVLHSVKCDHYDLNVKFFYFFSRNFTRSIVLGFWVKTLVNKNNSSSLILRNMELRFEPCVLNLIWKWCAKDPKKKEGHLIFINFGVKKFTVKNTENKQNFDVWML